MLVDITKAHGVIQAVLSSVFLEVGQNEGGLLTEEEQTRYLRAITDLVRAPAQGESPIDMMAHHLDRVMGTLTVEVSCKPKVDETHTRTSEATTDTTNAWPRVDENGATVYKAVEPHPREDEPVAPVAQEAPKKRAAPNSVNAKDEVLKALSSMGPATASEVKSALPHINHKTVSGRLASLRKEGYVGVFGQTKGDKHRDVSIYKLTNKGKAYVDSVVVGR